jgi:hypothetical protein
LIGIRAPVAMGGLCHPAPPLMSILALNRRPHIGQTHDF